jgi:ankyrin repeat protein
MEDVKTFHEQVKRGDLEGVRSALAENPLLLDAVNEARQNAFLLAKYYRKEDVADYLLSLNPQLDLFNAAVAGRVEQVIQQVEADPTVLESHSTDGWTPLHLAAFFGHSDLASALLDHGASIEIRSTNAMKNTPLHAAAAGGQVELVKLLAERGADMNATQDGGWTALHSAAQAGNREMVEVLLAHGADANARAANNQAPLDLAMLAGRQEIAELLEGIGAKLK